MEGEKRRNAEITDGKEAKHIDLAQGLCVEREHIEEPRQRPSYICIELEDVGRGKIPPSGPEEVVAMHEEAGYHGEVNEKQNAGMTAYGPYFDVLEYGFCNARFISFASEAAMVLTSFPPRSPVRIDVEVLPFLDRPHRMPCPDVIFGQRSTRRRSLSTTHSFPLPGR
jgi:hypothetical protein